MFEYLDMFLQNFKTFYGRCLRVLKLKTIPLCTSKSTLQNKKRLKNELILPHSDFAQIYRVFSPVHLIAEIILEHSFTCHFISLVDLSRFGRF